MHHHHHRPNHKRKSLAIPLVVVIIAIILGSVGAALFMDVQPTQQLVEKELDAQAFLQ